jgi:hypothetical protein
VAESALERSGSRAGPDYVGPTGSQVRREADCHTPSESAQDRCASRVCSDCVSDHALRAASMRTPTRTRAAVCVDHHGRHRTRRRGYRRLRSSMRFVFVCGPPFVGSYVTRTLTRALPSKFSTRRVPERGRIGRLMMPAASGCR